MNKSIRNMAGIIAITGLLLPGCGCGSPAGSDGMHEDPSSMDHDGGDGNSADDHHGEGDGHARTDGATQADGDGNGQTDGVDTMAPRTFMLITYSSPAEERNGTTAALNGLRAKLKAELEAVRGRLGKTSDPAAKEADQKRAAELAQGLERMDRLIAKVGEANDVSWADVRESSLKEAEEVRVWMKDYNMDNSI